MAGNKPVEDECIPRPNRNGRNFTMIGNKITKKGNILIQVGNTSNVASGDVYLKDNEINEEQTFTYQEGNVQKEEEYDENRDQATGASADVTSSKALPGQTKPIHGKLEEKHEKLLTKEYDYLLEEVDAKQLTSYLFSKFIINMDTQNLVLEKPTRMERTRVLFEKLLDSGPYRAFPEFINCLKSEYPHVAKRLEGQI